MVWGFFAGDRAFAQTTTTSKNCFENNTMQIVIKRITKKVDGIEVEFEPKERIVMEEIFQHEVDSLSPAVNRHLDRIEISYAGHCVYSAEVATVVKPGHMQCLKCDAFHGADGLVCAIHPDGPDKTTCEDFSYEQ